MPSPSFVRPFASALALVFGSLLPATVLAQITLNPGDRYRFVGADPEAVTSSNCGEVNLCGVDFGDLGVEAVRMYLATQVVAGVGGTTRSATGRLASFFSVSPGDDHRIGAKLIGLVRWRGWLQADIGAYDNTSSMNIRVSIYRFPDPNDPAHRELVASQTVNNSSVGGTISNPPVPNFERDIGQGGFAIPVDLERGQDYMVAVEATSTTTSGLVGFLAGNSYSNFDAGAPSLSDGYVERTSMTITLEPDYLALIDELRDDFEHHTHTYLTGRGEGHNNTAVQTSAPNEGPAGPAEPPGPGAGDLDAPGPALELATVAPELVRLLARVPAGSENPVIERRTGDTEWTAMASLSQGGTWEDGSVSAGRRYGYRLRANRSGVASLSEEVWVDVPTALALGLERTSPNPTPRDLTVDFALPSREPATLDLFDIQGRVVMTREVGSLGRGRHHFRWTPEGRIANGAYVLRLTQGGRSVTTKVTILR